MRPPFGTDKGGQYKEALTLLDQPSTVCLTPSLIGFSAPSDVSCMRFAGDRRAINTTLSEMANGLHELSWWSSASLLLTIAHAVWLAAARGAR